MRRFLGTYRCVCGRRVRVYDWLSECVLCAKCARDIHAAEQRAIGPDINNEERSDVYQESNRQGEP